MKKLIFLVGFITLFSTSCDVAKNVAGTYSLLQCEYSYNSISGLSLAGVNLQNINSISSLNPLTAASLLGAFSQQSVPLQFTLNLNVKNPNHQAAILNGLQYILEIDDIEMTTGAVNSQMQIATGQIAQLPVTIGFDLKKAMKGETADAVKNMAFNFVGLGDRSTRVTLKLKPNLNIGGQLLASPIYIPVSFTYGKSK
jgi:Late embryogenesis abundant protein.